VGSFEENFRYFTYIFENYFDNYRIFQLSGNLGLKRISLFFCDSLIGNRVLIILVLNNCILKFKRRCYGRCKPKN